MKRVAENCIGCGLCAAACPHGALSMRTGRDGVRRPRVDGGACTACGICARVCPQEPRLLREQAAKVSALPDPRRFGLDGAVGFLAWDAGDGRRRSASGGVVTALAGALLRGGRIDGVVHVKRLFAGRGSPHFQAVLSTTADDLEAGRGSAYEAVDFSAALSGLEKGGRYLVTGTPCVIRGIRRLKDSAPAFGGIDFITCALVCSHNVTPQLADYLADRHRVPRDARFAVDFRNKDGIANASKFNTRLAAEDGTDLLRMERTASGWTHVWRNCYFALDACCRCSDFWGAEADVSVKDAWGRRDWTADPLGKSIVLVRRADLVPVLRGAGLPHDPISADALASMQPAETSFKLVAAGEKASRGVLSRTNARNGLLRRLSMARLTRLAYAAFGYQPTRVLARLLRGAFDALDVFRHRAIPERTKTILVAGGYGYGNAGDEAQCAQVLKTLAERYPDREIVCLTPNPAYSESVHPGFRHAPASRVALFDQGLPSNCYRVATLRQRLKFLAVSALVLWNARRLRRGRMPLFANPRQIAFLDRLARASLFHFCGGGYLTGATRSRLWDGVLLCRLCRIFGVPVVMSGQTVGEWSGWMDRRLARWGFASVAVIATRDDGASLADLKRIGIAGDHVFATHDDALFSEKAAARELPEGPYVAVNFHFWKMAPREQSVVLARLHEILRRVGAAKPDCRLVFVPMVASDLKSLAAFCARYPDVPIAAFDCGCDYRRTRRAIADADLVLTMKHHPIIFAVGEGVPVVSMAYSDYYVHKNVGALAQYGLASCSFDLAAADWERGFAAAFAEVRDRDRFVRQAGVGVDCVRAREERFWTLTDRVALIDRER